jgi:MFS family permease
MFAYTGFLGIVLQGGLISRLVRRFGEPSLVSAGFITLCISYLGLSMAHTVPALVLVATISSFGNGVMRPSLSSLISQISQRHEQGVVMGLSQSLHSLAALIAHRKKPAAAVGLAGRAGRDAGPGVCTLWIRSSPTTAGRTSRGRA